MQKPKISLCSLVSFILLFMVGLVSLACVGMAASASLSVFVAYVLPVVMFLASFALIGAVVVLAVWLLGKLLL